jgi:predicted AAA+ superfamily ATPase
LKNFEDALISLQAYIDEGKINLDIYVTGSNNKKLSSKISSNFTGRHNDFILYPYDFHELLEFYSYIFNNIKISNNYEKSLFLYSYFGGFGKIIFEIEKNKDIFQR